MHLRVLLVCAAVTFSGVASAQTEDTAYFDVEIGTNDPSRESLDVRDAIDAPPISQLGPDAFRYIEQPALGGRGYIISVQRRRNDAVLDASWMYGHRSLGWRRTRHQRFVISLDLYLSLSEWIDEELDRAAQAPPRQGDVIAVCADGPGATTERISDGHVRWMSGSCGDLHPNDIVRERMLNLVLDLVGTR